MLFAINTQSFSSLFATHPPLEERIRALQPGFRGRAQKGGETQGEHQVDMAAGLAPGQSAAQSVAQVHRRPEQVSALVGNPGHEHVVQAMALRGAVAESVYAATQSPESALHLCLALVLAQDIEARAAQLAWIEQHYDIPTQTQVASLFVALQAMGPGYRLPLLELVFPALKRRAEAEIERLMLAIQQLVRVDERIDTYEYLVLRMLRSQLLDVNPQLRMRPRASLSLAECGEEAATVLAILAHQAHDDAGDAQSACAAGGAHLSLAPALASKSVSADWMTELDDALTCLDTLAAQHKARLVEAMVKVVMHDGALALTEAELLRAICSALHCPLPPLLPVLPLPGTQD